MTLAGASAFLPGIVLAIFSYMTYGYLTPSIPVIVATILASACLTLCLSFLGARRLWTRRSYTDALLVVGLTGVAFFFAVFAALSYLTGYATCFGCDFGWFFSLVVPTLILDFVAGIVWLVILVDVWRARRVWLSDFP